MMTKSYFPCLLLIVFLQPICRCEEAPKRFFFGIGVAQNDPTEPALSQVDSRKKVKFFQVTDQNQDRSIKSPKFLLTLGQRVEKRGENRIFVKERETRPSSRIISWFNPEPEDPDSNRKTPALYVFRPLEFDWNRREISSWRPIGSARRDYFNNTRNQDLAHFTPVEINRALDTYIWLTDRGFVAREIVDAYDIGDVAALQRKFYVIESGLRDFSTGILTREMVEEVDGFSVSELGEDLELLISETYAKSVWRRRSSEPKMRATQIRLWAESLQMRLKKADRVDDFEEFASLNFRQKQVVISRRVRALEIHLNGLSTLGNAARTTYPSLIAAAEGKIQSLNSIL